MVKATLHGSMRKHYDKFQEVNAIFTKAGIEVIAPKITEVIQDKEGFVYSKGDDTTKSPVQIETDFLSKVASLDPREDFAYIINPEGYFSKSASTELAFLLSQQKGYFSKSASTELASLLSQQKGYIGKSAAAELAFLLSQQKRVFALEEITDPPLPLPNNYVYTPEELVRYYIKKGDFPVSNAVEKDITDMIQKTFYPLPAVGGIIVDENSKIYTIGKRKEKNIGLVQKSEWGGKYTLLGGTKLPGESDAQRLKKEFEQQLGISQFYIGQIIISFLEKLNSGYQNIGIHREFKDYITSIPRKENMPNWIRLPPSEAIKYTDIIEPNAMETIKKYRAML